MKSIIMAKKRAQFLSKKNNIKLKEALEFVAQENKFISWKDYKNSLDTFWYKDSSPFLNHWFTVHSEAVECKNRTNGYLLTYKGQYFVATSDYIEFLGLDPKSEIWHIVGYDVSSSSSIDKIYDYLKGDHGVKL